MLRALEIRDLLIIERLELAFQPGLNVLTGETGAGKSILLDSLGFVLGWRGRAELVRAGAEQGEVTAEFHLSSEHPALAVLAEAGLPVEDTLILRRVNTSDGRKTAWVNDRRVSGEILRALSDTLVELHGQHDDRGLLNPRGHRAMLDAYGACQSALAATRSAWVERRRAMDALAATEASLRAAQEEEDFLRHAVAELTELDPQPGEDETLDTARRTMQAAERIRGDVAKAHALLGGDGAERATAEALRWLEGAGHTDDSLLDGPIKAVEDALNTLSEASAEVERALAAMDIDPGQLERTEERLFALRALARKHNVVPNDLADLAQTLQTKLDALDAGADTLKADQARLAEADATYDAAATKLTAARAKAAKALDKAVTAELAPLKMERAVFVTQLDGVEPGPDGRDAVTFTVATNPGAPAGPLNKIASGGELSRFLLALKVCLTGHKADLTMIFDEIDRGVGGATADAVGRRLAALARDGQVLVVTHSPQVAAKGEHHWRVAKRVKRGVTLSHVEPLTGNERTDELARMLAGDTLTEEARAAARVLLAG